MHNCTITQLDTPWLYWATMEVALLITEKILGTFISVQIEKLICLNCKKYIQKIQEFTPGDIPDNSPVQWHGTASPVATTTTSHYYCYCLQLPLVQGQCFSPKANNARPILRSLLSTMLHCLTQHFTTVLWLVRLTFCTMAVDQGQTTKRGRDATFGQTVKFSNYCFPTILDFSVSENIIFSFL